MNARANEAGVGYLDATGQLLPERVRADFPLLARPINGHPLTYLDSAASAQMPLAVLQAIDQYQTELHANVHRGVHTLSQRATAAFEGAREHVRGTLRNWYYGDYPYAYSKFRTVTS